MKTTYDLATRIDNIIEKLKKIHNNYYDYRFLPEDYVNNKSTVKIICPKHGVFKKSIATHARGVKCPECSSILSAPLNTRLQHAIKRMKIVHDNRYDYSKTHENFKSTNSIIWVGCPEHGWFKVKVNNHINGAKCPNCSVNHSSLKNRLNKVIKKISAVHKNKYDLSRIHEDFKNSKSKVWIGCPEHGWFRQKISSTIQGHGCSKCRTYYEQSLDFRCRKMIEKAKSIHGVKYSYKNVAKTYKHIHTKVEIICPYHGSFKQTMASHVKGKGCKLCKDSKMERAFRLLMMENQIIAESEWKFDNLISNKKCPLRFDFYLPDYNTCVECDGPQHHHWVPGIQTKEQFKRLKYHDQMKNEYCRKNGIKLIRLTKEDFAKPKSSLVSLIVD
jgi:very-short-patch-repair endonuclease